jgi:hypothetical protein
MRTPEEINEIRQFTITVFTCEAACNMAPTDEIASELIVLAASYGPSKTKTER